MVTCPISSKRESPANRLPPSVASEADGLTPSQDSFMVFVSVWTLLILIYLALAPRFFSAFAHPMAMLGLDALTMLFWFAGFIALAVLHHQFEGVYLGDGLGMPTTAAHWQGVCAARSRRRRYLGHLSGESGSPLCSADLRDWD